MKNNKELLIRVGLIILVVILIIAFPFVFKISGNEEQKEEIPVNNVTKKTTIVEAEEDTIDDVTKETTKVSEKVTKENTTKKKEDKTETTKKVSGGIETTTESKKNTTTTTKKKTSTTTKKNGTTSTTTKKTSTTTTTTTTVAVDEVDALRNSIQGTYGITIKYGDEIGNYHPKGLTPVRMTDKDEIKTYLNKIKTELAKYPSGFFKEMKNFNMPLTLFLVSSVPGNSFAGFTDREYTYDIKLTIVKSYDFEYTLNHEIMHYIDAYLECKMYPETPYTDYIALNPPGYSYGSYIERYNFYGYTGDDKEVYFMDNYGQTNPREDRAQVFRQMITRSYKYPGMFDEGTILQKKALIIDKQIRQYYSSAKGTLTWDKFIK